MKKSKTWKQWMIYLILILSLLSCRLPFDLLNGDETEQPSDAVAIEPINTIEIVTVAPTETIPPTPVPTPTSTPDPLANLPEHVREAMLWETAISDDFSDNTNEWYTGETQLDEQLMTREIVDGQYLLTIERLQNIDRDMFVKAYIPAQISSYTDFYAVVSAGLLEGDEDTIYGLEFRGSFVGGYSFQIRGDSYNLIEKDFQTSSTLIDWTRSEAIFPEGMNKLGVVANGNKITLFINDTIVADLEDTTFLMGETFFVNQLSATGERATVVFEDLLIKTRAATIYKDVSTWPLAIEDAFVTLKDGWVTGTDSNEYFDIMTTLENGQYYLEATPKQAFIRFRIPEGINNIGDAYLSVDFKVGGSTDESYAGLVFRNTQEGSYLFRAGKFSADLYWFDVLMLYQNQWQTLVPQLYSPSERADDVIRMGVMANGPALIFLINDEIYAEIKDDHLSDGTAGIAIGINEGGEADSWQFSNFKVHLPGIVETLDQGEQPAESAETDEQNVQASPTTGVTRQSGQLSGQSTIEASEAVLNPKDGAELVYIPEGEFLMGYEGEKAEEDEAPEHPVFLDEYWINKTPVTNSQYRLCIQDGGCDATLERYPDDSFPAVRVTWQKAEDYCRWAGGQLPSEAEWEKAARGTDERIYPWGDDAPDCSFANFKGCYSNQLTEAGRFVAGASPYGALDMLGTVWEWVGDWYDEGYYLLSPYQNPTGPKDGDMKVQRGHSFESDLIYLRLTDRAGSNPDNGDYRKGFRCVFDEQP